MPSLNRKGKLVGIGILNQTRNKIFVRKSMLNKTDKETVKVSENYSKLLKYSTLICKFEKNQTAFRYVQVSGINLNN